MATLITINRYSSKKYKGSKRRNSLPDNYEYRKMYTYVLKDLVKGIYKIGKTTNPHARFKSLCRDGRVLPIALINKDVESILHKEFAENRINNLEFKNNGGTEWFKRGGTFDAFIDKIDKGVYLPHITMYTMVNKLIKEGVIRLNDSIIEWELAQSSFGYYLIGLELLKMLDYITVSGHKIYTEGNKDVLIIGRKVSVIEDVVNIFRNNYTIYISHRVKDGIIGENKNKNSRLRKVIIETNEFDSEMFLLLNKVL